MRYLLHHGRRVTVRDGQGREFKARGTSFRGKKVILELSEDIQEDPAPHFWAWASKRPISDQVLEARLAVGLSQEELSNLSGVESNYISKIEHGRVMPNGNLLARLAKGLGVSLVIGPTHPTVKCRANTKVPAEGRYRRNTAPP